jgi:hypothetical protein
MIEYHKEAVEDFSSVIKRNPKNAHAHFRRAFSLKSLKVSLTNVELSLFRDLLRLLMTLNMQRRWRHLTRNSW